MSELKSEPGSSWPRSPAMLPARGSQGVAGITGELRALGRTWLPLRHRKDTSNLQSQDLGHIVPSSHLCNPGSRQRPVSPWLRAYQGSPQSTMRFQSEDTPGFLLLLYLTPLLTFQSSLRMGLGHHCLCEACFLPTLVFHPPTLLPHEVFPPLFPQHPVLPSLQH